jgi:hypothetical protein
VGTLSGSGEVAGEKDAVRDENAAQTGGQTVL